MNKYNKGLFISFEGGDASGKTTTLSALKKYILEIKEQILEKNLNVIFTREPGGKELSIAESIRSILFNSEEKEMMEPWTEALLFAAARTEHVNKLIIPNLLKNNIVITDRYVDSSYVYQGLNLKLGYEEIKELNNKATNSLLPDLTFYFEVPENIIKERLELKKNKNDNFNFLDERELNNSFITKNNYEKVLSFEKKMFNRKIIFIDGTKPYNENVEKIWIQIQKAWKKNDF